MLESGNVSISRDAFGHTWPSLDLGPSPVANEEEQKKNVWVSTPTGTPTPVFTWSIALVRFAFFLSLVAPRQSVLS